MIIAVILIIFLLLQVLPGNPVQVMMKEKTDPATIERISEQMGLNDPLIVRFGRYLWDMLHGDLGFSYKFKRPIVDLIKEAFPNTVRLAISSALVAWLIGIPTGIVSAIKKDTMLDRTLMTLSLVGISLPVFWLAMLLQYFFGYKLGVLPISGYSTWKHMILPAIVLGWSSSGSIARLTRSSLLGVMKNDYIRTAKAKGLRNGAIIVRHGLKNSMIPVESPLRSCHHRDGLWHRRNRPVDGKSHRPARYASAPELRHLLDFDNNPGQSRGGYPVFVPRP